MRILLALIPISLALLGIAIAFFAWAVRSGQFEDLDSAALDVLTDDTKPAPPLTDGDADDHAARARVRGNDDAA